jgi:hypothetical protein
MKALLALNPIRALRDYWSQSSPEAHLAVGTPGFAGAVAHIDWAAVLSFTCLALMTLGGTIFQLYKQYKFMRFEIQAREQELFPATPLRPPLKSVE